MKKSLTIFLAGLTLICCLAAVGCNDKGEHSFASEWSYDDSYHWKQCTDSGCNEVAEKAEHRYELTGTINRCGVCGHSYDTAGTYEVNITSVGGKELSQVSVTMYDQTGASVGTAKSNVRGKARFKLNPGEYVAKIDQTTLPKGYYLPEELKEISFTKDKKSFTASLPSTIIDEEMPAGNVYKVGDVAYSFTTTAVTASGTTKPISLAAYLSQYKAVVLNFWYSDCSPCRAEFPYMNEVYSDYKDKIALIAINNGYDGADGVAKFVRENGYVFDFVNDESMFDYYSAYDTNSFPTTVVIDRYGVVAVIEKGTMPSTAAWKGLFDYYLADDYMPDYSSGYKPEEDDDNVGDLTKPDIEMPDGNEMAKVATKVNDYTSLNSIKYSAYDDEYSWPWIITEKEGEKCISTSNRQKLASYSILVIDVELKAGQQIFYDYFCSTEQENDLLYIQVDSVLQYTISGVDEQWNKDKLLYVAVEDGRYQITLTYQKDATAHTADDTVYIKNIRIEENKAIEGHYDLLYNATTNYTLDSGVTPPAEYEGYLNAVAYYLNEEDGLYHVALSGNADERRSDDPILLADLYYSTPWNTNSVWMLAYSQVGLFNPADESFKPGYYQKVEDYTWMQQNSSSRYVPVNEELKEILINVVANIGRTDHSNDPHNGEAQWLEVCRYYVNYGTPQSKEVCFACDNTVLALNWRVAEDWGTVGRSNVAGNLKNIHVNVYSVHLPRGNYYKITTTDAGAYLIRSNERIASDYDTKAQDPMGFLCDDQGRILDENDSYVMDVQGYDEKGYPLYDNNFYMFVYLEANKTYYIGACFYDTLAIGEYDVTIEYLGEEYSYFTACAYDTTYTYDENDPSFAPYVLPKMGKNRFFIGDDGNYYAQEHDGSKGSLIYIRIVGTTFLNGYTEYTLEQLINAGAFGSTLEEKLYLKDQLVNAITTYPEGHELYGYVPASEKLVNLINVFANGGDGAETNTYASTSWLLAAYYYRNVNITTLNAAKDKLNNQSNAQ